MLSTLKNLSLWKRIWISLSILIFISIEFIALVNSQDESIVNVLFFRAPIVSAVISLIIFLICLLVNWINEGLKNGEIGEFAKFSIKVILVTTSVAIIYFIASPYQNCLRNLQGSEGFVARSCTQNTSW
jgi:hypothetical protein